MLGDQPAALYGQDASPRMAALTLGTGAFLWLNVGAEMPEPPSGVLATAAWEKRSSGPTYALEAFCANAGNVLALLPPRLRRWRSSGLRLVSPPSGGRSCPGGLGTPRWHGADRITVLGASSTTTAADLAAAALAGVAHQIADALDAVDAGSSADVLRVGGGLSAHDGLLQAVADLSGLTFEVPGDTEATARGIAALAAEAVGLLDERVAAGAIVQRVQPRLDDAERARERAAGRMRSRCTRGWRRERRGPGPGRADRALARLGATARRPRRRRRDHRGRHSARRGLPGLSVG